MDYKIVDLEKSHEKEYVDFVINHNESSLFHTLKWKQFLESTGYKTCYKIALKNDKIVGILPLVRTWAGFRRVLVSLPFFEAAGPLIDTENEECLPLLIPNSPCLIRSYSKLPKSTIYANTFILTAKNFDYIWSIIWKQRTGIRTVVRKAQRDGIVIKPFKSTKIMHKLISLKNKRYGTPAFSHIFLDKLFSIFPETYSSAAFINDKPIGFMISIPLKKTNHLLILATDPDYRKIFKDEILYVDHIKKSFDMGCARVDLGRAKPGSGNESNKKHLGGVPKPLYSLANGIKYDYYSYSSLAKLLRPIINIINKTTFCDTIRKLRP